MPSPTSLSPFVSNYIEAFLLGTHNKTPELKDTLFGLFSLITPEEIIEKASALYKRQTYGSLAKPQIIRNMQFLLDQFISLHTPYGLAPYCFKKDKLTRLFFQGVSQELSDFREQVAQAETTEAILQKNTLRLSCKSFSFDKFINEKLKEKIPDEIMISNAEKLAHDLRNLNTISFLNIKPQDVYEFKDSQTDNTYFSKIMLESQKVTGIIIYDLLWGASSISHRRNVARFYLETLRCCLRDHDYHSAMPIYVALSKSDIERLEYLKEILFELEKISCLLSLEGGFLALKNKLKALQEESLNKKHLCKAVPYLGLYSQGLMYIKGTTYKEKGEVEKLRRIGKICREIKCYQMHLRQLISQRGLYYNFLERAFEVDDDQMYERSQLLKKEWMALSKVNKKRAQNGKPYQPKEISVKKEHKITWVDKLRDALLSPSILLPEQRLAIQHFLPICASRTSIDYSGKTSGETFPNVPPHKIGKTLKP